MAKKTKSFDLKSAIRSNKKQLYESLLAEALSGKGIAKTKAIELLARFGEFDSESEGEVDIIVSFIEIKRDVATGDIVPVDPMPAATKVP
jgi:hypothetical protein